MRIPGRGPQDYPSPQVRRCYWFSIAVLPDLMDT